MKVIEDACKSKEAPSFCPWIRIKYPLKVRPGEKQRFSYGNHKGLEILTRPESIKDRKTCALAVAALDRLGELGLPGEGRKLSWACCTPNGREDLRSSGKSLSLVDGAHNEDGAAKLAESIQFYFTNRRIIYIMGILKIRKQKNDPQYLSVCGGRQLLWLLRESGLFHI